MWDAMKSAVMHEVGHFTIENREIPTIGDLDALVQVNYVGVCGSDMALFQYGYIGQSHVDGDIVLGHEASGTVVQTGEHVANLKVGDRVAMEPGVPCRACDLCNRGLYNLCPDVYFWASLPVTEGALQEFVRHPAEFCHVLPANVSLLEGALIEPMAVSVHAVERSGAAIGQTAVILGAGAIGLLTLLTLRAAGVRNVVVIDLVANRLELAEAFGAVVIDASESLAVDEVRARFGLGPDLVFETAGNEVSMDQAIQLARPGGTIVFVGYTKSGRADLNVNLLVDKELSIRTVFRYRHVYPKAIELVASGAVPVREIVSAIYSFDDAQKGMEDAIHNKSRVTKSVICVSPEK